MEVRGLKNVIDFALLNRVGLSRLPVADPWMETREIFSIEDIAPAVSGTGGGGPYQAGTTVPEKGFSTGDIKGAVYPRGGNKGDKKHST